MPDVPRCFKKIEFDASPSRDPEGDSFTSKWSLAMAPRASKLNAHPDPEDAHASFDQELLVATLRPDREGEYRGEIEVYDGCASAVTAYFEVTVVWDETCVTDAETNMTTLAAPLGVALFVLLVVAATRLPPLRWTHPRQVTLDARAAAAARKTEEERLIAHAEAIVDGPRLRAKAEADAIEGRKRRRARRDANKEILFRAVPPREANKGVTARTRGLGDREPANERERKVMMLAVKYASVGDRYRALKTLLGDYFADFADTMTRAPTRVFFKCRSTLVKIWMWFFHVPGGWMGVMLRAHLILELPALVAVFIRDACPPFARDGGGVSALVNTLTPAIFLGPNMTREETYTSLSFLTGAAFMTFGGPALARVARYFARRAWKKVWENADVVENGGVLPKISRRKGETRKDGERKAIKDRQERIRKAGYAIPKEMWENGTDAQTLKCLDDHIDNAAIQRVIQEREDDEVKMEDYARLAMRHRRRARRYERLSRLLVFTGVVAIAVLATIGFFPSVHVGLATLIPMAHDHARPWVYFARDPAIFFFGVDHLTLVASGFFVAFAAFACAVFRANATANEVVTLRPQPAFEMIAVVAKTVIAGVGVYWEGQIGKEPVAAAREGVVEFAWTHDVVVTMFLLALLGCHVGMQSLRGDASGWNQWRAAAYAGAAWTGVLSIAAKANGQDPDVALMFLNEPSIAGGGAPASAGDAATGNEMTWRAVLAGTLPVVMYLAAALNKALFRHVCLAEEVARPPSAIKRSQTDVSGEESARKKTQTRAGMGMSKKASKYATSSEPNTPKTTKKSVGYHTDDDDADDVEAGGATSQPGSATRRRSALSRFFSFGGGVNKTADAFDDDAPGPDGSPSSPRSPSSKRPNGGDGRGGKRTAVDFARSKHLRDRVVAWLCEFQRLATYERELVAKITEAKTGTPAVAIAATEELLTLAEVLLADPELWIRAGADDLAHHALTALTRAAGAAAIRDPALAWRAIPWILKALKSPIPSLRASAAEAVTERDFATATAALLFHRHDVGLKRPSAFEWRRVVDALFEDPILFTAQDLEDTGLAREEQLEAAWRGDWIVPWPVIQRGRARTILEMDVGGDDGAVTGSGDVALHRALVDLDPTGEAVGGTALVAANGKNRPTNVSLGQLRERVRREELQRARAKMLESSATGEISDEEEMYTMRTRADAMSAEELSTFRPDVLARRDAEDAEAESGRLTDLELFLSRLRRFKPPAPIDAGFNAVKKVALSIGASAALKRARAAHDATRRKRAKALMENLLDAALGGRGDEVKRFAGDRLCLPVGSEAWKQKEAKDAAARAAAKALKGVDPHARPPTPPKGQKGLAKPIPKSAAVTSKDKGKTAEEEAEETRLASRPASLPAPGAAAAMRACGELVDRPGGAPAFLHGSKRFVAAALRASGGSDRPPGVVSRAGVLVGGVVNRRRLRGTLLRRLGEVCASLEEDWDASDELREDPDAENLALRAIEATRRAATFALKDRRASASLAILVAEATRRGDVDALEGKTGLAKNALGLKLRARAAADAARATDKSSVAVAARGVAALVGDRSPQVRAGACAALSELAKLLVAAEATSAAGDVARRVGDADDDARGAGRIPRMRWTVDDDDFETGRGPGDDDLAPEDEYPEDDPYGIHERKGDDDDVVVDVGRGGGVRLPGRATTAAKALDSAWCVDALTAAIARDPDAHAKVRSIHWFPYDPVRVVNADP